MRRWSASEGQTEPLAALVAVVVVGLALSLYAGAVETALPGPADRRHGPVADGVERTATVGGVVDPDRLSLAVERAPAGYEVNVSLAVGDRVEHAGPPAPASDDVATAHPDRTVDSRRVSVRIGDGRVEPGRLEVRVWT